MPLPECLRESARAATPRRSRWGLVTAAACVVVLAALGGWAARGRFSKPGDASPQSNAANEQQRPATAVVERPSAPPSWEGVSDEALRKFDRELSDFQDRSARDWPSDPRD